MSEKTLFQVFSIPREHFSKDLLRASYHALIKQAHPDKTALDPGSSTEAAQFINRAYKVLSNDYSRSVYEYSLDNAKNLVKKDLSTGIFQSAPITVLDLEKEQIGCNKGLVNAEFLDEILSLEDKIECTYGPELDRVEQSILKEIELCKQHRTDPRALARWRYYSRLIDIILQKKMLE
ncbi:uncharacterized protein NEMAJ01_0359 [Nematocida major]|uniref:uncharacterized protein n=1 Tax=Nematocida major TaxID=1912982 RepID=UPI00200857EE|nr:uncharacterized protein NEMAJ01_0359 [Nematocida major]KAH9385463.1 hypothetical protein NEMAJ01_0359 [Nematocida major]